MTTKWKKVINTSRIVVLEIEVQDYLDDEEDRILLTTAIKEAVEELGGIEVETINHFATNAEAVSWMKV